MEYFPAQAWGIFFFVQALFFIVLGFKKGLFSIGGGELQQKYQLDGTKEY
ncbi:hypothetical protein V7087_16635 [Neobacillus niacini]